MKKIFAKPDEILIVHIKKCLNVWSDLKEKYQADIGDKQFWEDSYKTVLFHDIGKMIDSFQEMMIARQQKRMPDFENNFRHELFSGVFVSGIFGNQNLLPTLAVLTHHKKLNSELFVSDKNKDVKYNVNDIVDFVKYFDFGNGQDYSRFPPNWNNGEKFYNVFHNIFRLLNQQAESDRKKYIFYKGILNTCDWFASGNRKLQSDIDINSNDLICKIEKRIDKSIQFTDFQQSCLKTKNNCLAISPTGSGKTEAALLWAEEKNGKIIYLLPTKVTSNAIFDRLVRYFGNENIGLVHSSAINDREDNYDVKEYFIEKNFYKPITVATIDQILTIGFNVGHWAVKSLNLVGSKIIIDEIHAYDFYTLGLTIATIRYFQQLGTKFFLMSATMPDYLKELFLQEIKDIELIQNEKLLNQTRNKFIVHKESVDSLNDEIIQSVNNNKKTLIVVNTVDEAIRLYEKYQKFNPICYHSRFISKDRKQKEKEIIIASKSDSNGCLVITTQVVEVSLDIDFDILFTENAPADSIIQRAGRVNRKGEKSNTKVVIFKHQDITENKIYNKTILHKTITVFSKFHNKNIAEKDFVSIVNEVYSSVDILNDDDYVSGLTKYDKIQKHYKFIGDANASDGDIFTRAIDYIKIPVIPDQFLDEVLNLTPLEKSQYQVSLPYWVKSKFAIYPKDNFDFGDIDYNYERGAVISSLYNQSSFFS